MNKNSTLQGVCQNTNFPCQESIPVVQENDMKRWCFIFSIDKYVILILRRTYCNNKHKIYQFLREWKFHLHVRTMLL